MTVSLPVTTEDVPDLPDTTELVESLDSASSTTVLPVFMGTGEPNRFVTGYYKVEGSTLSLYVRRPDGGLPGSLEFAESVELEKEPTVVGEVWNRTILFEEPDAETVEWVRQRLEYETSWLSSGEDPDESFAEFSEKPFSHDSRGIPDCDNTDLTPAFKPPNLDIELVCCRNCGRPINLKNSDGGLHSWDEVIQADFVGLPPAESNTDVRGVPVSPEGELSNAEVTLHMYTRYARMDTGELELYARNDRRGYLLCLGDAVIGYVLWSRFGDYTALQQRYIHPEFRGDRLGTILLKAWYDHVDVDWYFTIKSNEAARGSLKTAGHLDEGIARPATVLSCRDSDDPALHSPSFVDRRRGGIEASAYRAEN